MNTDRTVLVDAMWARVEFLLPGRKSDPGVTAAVLWRTRTGSPWRDIPERFGKPNSVFRRFRHWVKTGVFQRVSSALSGDFDLECAFVDGTVVKVRQKAAGSKKKGAAEGIGRSRGGLTTRTVAVVDALGCLVRFVTVPGQTHDPKGMKPLLEGLELGGLIGNLASGADWLLEELDRRESEAVIPAKRNRAELREHDWTVYGWRHLADSFFARTREFRVVATRCDRTMESYAAAVHLVAGVIAAKWLSPDPGSMVLIVV